MYCQSEETGTNTLFVGEGDFSFSAYYVQKIEGCKEKVFASCLNSGSLTLRQKNNIKILEERGGQICTDVDATCLESHPEINKFRFSKIIFNFPHIPGKMNIRNNRQLVQQFFLSAEKILEDSGTIIVTLCQGQGGTEIERVRRKWCDSWQIVCLAASASLILFKVKCFDAEEFKTYKCTGFRGLQKPFNTTGALTHIFKRGKPVEISIENSKINTSIVDIYLQDCIALHKLVNRNLCKPPFKVLSVLNGLSMKIFQPCDQVIIDDLLTCTNSSLFSSDLSVNMSIDYCRDCISQLFALFSRKKISGFVTSVSCSLCCLKSINLEKPPIHHLLSYFSDHAEPLLTTLPVFLKHLSQVYTLQRGKKMFSSENDSGFLKQEISRLLHDNQEPASEKLSVKCVADLYAKYSIHKGDELFYYSAVDCFLSTDKLLCDTIVKEGDQIMKIGTVLQYNENLENLTCILLNFNTLACLKYHILDHRVLFSEKSFYCLHEVLGSVEKVYRSSSLYPPTYVHDTSFYIEQDFHENEFFMVVKNTVGPLIKSVTLIDTYYDKNLEKQSRCYRFVYQSCDLVLSKEKANEIHTFIMRSALQNSLNICLR